MMVCVVRLPIVEGLVGRQAVGKELWVVRVGDSMERSPEEVRITIRLDRDIVDHFRDQVRRAHRCNYQTLIDDALRDYVRRSGMIITATPRAFSSTSMMSSIAGERLTYKHITGKDSEPPVA